jgi:general secretion pathway protein D
LISGPSSTLLELGYNSSGGNFTSAIRLLESFGTVKVLSSPKLSVMNNQTAVMKVVDDNIYFTFEIDEREATQYAAAKTTVKSTMHSVPVGLVLAITPQIGDDESVTLNIRPSLSRVIGQKVDPSIQLATSNTTVTNTIPIIRAREFDSVMRVSNGNIAVMGGLMEDLLSNTDDTVPGLGALPILGGLFQNRDDTKRKTELVIFVRPTVLRNTSLEGDYSVFRRQLPDTRYFKEDNGPTTFSLPGVDK